MHLAKYGRALWPSRDHPHLLQTYIDIYKHTKPQIEHDYLTHANAFGNYIASGFAADDIKKNLSTFLHIC